MGITDKFDKIVDSARNGNFSFREHGDDVEKLRDILNHVEDGYLSDDMDMFWLCSLICKIKKLRYDE